MIKNTVIAAGCLLALTTGASACADPDLSGVKSEFRSMVNVRIDFGRTKVKETKGCQFIVTGEIRSRDLPRDSRWMARVIDDTIIFAMLNDEVIY